MRVAGSFRFLLAEAAVDAYPGRAAFQVSVRLLMYS